MLGLGLELVPVLQTPSIKTFMNNQSKNKLKATHIDCKIPAHDMIDVCNFDLKVTLLALGRQLADLLYQLKDDCSHISCFS